MYQSCFSITASVDDLTITVFYLNVMGVETGPVTIAQSFIKGNTYGLTLSITTGFQGFLDFRDQDDNTLLIYAINPSEIESAGLKGSGGTPYVAKSTKANLAPIVGVATWVTSDIDGVNIVAGTLYSNDSGEVEFMLESGVNYVWRRHSSYTFDNPETVTI